MSSSSDTSSSPIPELEQITYQDLYNHLIFPRRFIPEVPTSSLKSQSWVYQSIQSILQTLSDENLIFSRIRSTFNIWEKLQPGGIIDKQTLKNSLNELRPEEKLPLYMVYQNCCLIFKRNSPKQDFEYSIAFFQVNAENAKVMRNELDLEMEYPQGEVDVYDRDLLLSEKFSE